MKKGITIEARFFNAAGKFIGASCFDFEGRPEAIASVIHENEELDENILEFLAVRAGVRWFRSRSTSYSYEAKIYDIDEPDKESAEN